METHDLDTESLLNGRAISGRYQLIKFLGSGAMGGVFLARDKVLSGNIVAIKILRQDKAHDENVKRRFLQEVQLMHRVNHPNVIRTYDVGVDGDLFYFTMEYVNGVTLEKFVHDGGIDLSRIDDVITQICEGLEAIHEANIIHRDLKPSNIILVGDRLKIADFGVAKSVDSNLTHHQEIIGSTSYIAPEVWQGSELTHILDFYSFGIILYELTTGRVPFEHDNPARIMWMHVKQDPEPPKLYRPEMPDWLNFLILSLLAKSPADRPQTERDIIDLVRRKPSDYKQLFPNARIRSVPKPVHHFRHRVWNYRGTESAGYAHSHMFAFLKTELVEFYMLTSEKRTPRTDDSGAAQIALESVVKRSVGYDGKVTTASLQSALSYAHEEVLQTYSGKSLFRSNATSACVLALTRGKIVVAYVGECHAYLVCHKNFFWLTNQDRGGHTIYLGDLTHDPGIVTAEHHHQIQKNDVFMIASCALHTLVQAQSMRKSLVAQELTRSVSSVLELVEDSAPDDSISGFLIGVEDYNDEIHQSELVYPGDVELSISHFSRRSNRESLSDYSAQIPELPEGEPESSLPVLHYLTRDGVELGQIQEEETTNHNSTDPKNSIIFAERPTTEEIILQHAHLVASRKDNDYEFDEDEFISSVIPTIRWLLLFCILGALVYFHKDIYRQVRNSRYVSDLIERQYNTHYQGQPGYGFTLFE